MTIYKELKTEISKNVHKKAQKMPAENQTNPKLKDVKDIVEVCTDFASFETACRNELRNRNLLLTFITREPGKNTQVNSATFSIDQVLDEIEGLKTDLFTYFKNHKDIQPYPGEYQVQIKNGSSKTILTSAPRVIFKGTGTKTDPKTKPGTTAAPTATSSMTKDILTALPSVVSAIQLLQPKPQPNNDNKLIIDFMKMQQDNSRHEQERLDRLESQRRADKKEMQDLAQSLAARSPVQDLAELEEFRQQVNASNRSAASSLPNIAGVNAAGQPSSPWDKLAELGGKWLESAMVAHQQRQTEAQTAESIDAKRAEIAEMAESEITVTDYLNDLTKLIQEETEPVAILKGIQQLLTFAKENDQLDQIPELIENEYDLEMSLLALLDSRTENKEYIQAIMKTAEPFLPLVSAELGFIDKESSNGHNEKPEYDNIVGVAATVEEPVTQETV